MNSVQIGAAVWAPLEVQVAVVVVANPHNAEQVAGVTGEPSVMRAASLSGGGIFESSSADGGDSPRPKFTTPSIMSVMTKATRGIEHLAFLGREVLHHVAFRIAYRNLTRIGEMRDAVDSTNAGVSAQPFPAASRRSAPSAIAGVALTEVMPALLARSATLSYPTSSATFTVALFRDIASA